MDLGKEKISKLLIKFSIPCVISMLINSIYNIVDQIFIGQGVGYLGNGATNVVFPLVVIATALALLLGDGSASYLSLNLGEKNEKGAKKGIGSSICFTFIVAIVVFLISFIFLSQILTLFGCTEGVRDYAEAYGRIISIGLPFMIIYTTLNSIIRADGSPKFSMISMVSGAVLNIILDYVFVIRLEWGVEGAAYATIIGQIVSFIISCSYIFRFKSIKLGLKDFRPDKSIIKVMGYGISSFITQITIVVVMIFMNNALTKYGAQSKFGADIPLSVYGIVMKVNQIFTSMVVGITVGSQPIIGFNYGAGNIKRVKDVIKTVLKINLCVGIIGTICFEFFPAQITNIFGSGESDLYIEFAVLCFRYSLLLTILNTVQITSSIFFQSLGKPKYAAICSISRQILFLIPSIFILGKIFGIMGCLCAGIVSDSLAFVLAVILLIRVYRALENINTESHTLESNNEAIVDDIYNKLTITINREYGSGGRYIGKLLSESLGIKFYDKEIIDLVSKETGFAESFIESNEQTKTTTSLSNTEHSNNDDELFISESNIIKDIASKDSCVIIGRCADYILKDKENVFKIFLYNSEESKVRRATEFYGLNEKTALKEIRNKNKLREKHYKYYTNLDWKNSENYDLSINVDYLGLEGTVALIKELITKKYETTSQKI